MEIIKLYINLNACKIDLQNNQKHQRAKTGRCKDYYNCVQANAHLVEQNKRLSPEICSNLFNQHFDVQTLTNNFKQLETIGSKICDLKRSMPEIRKYMKTESGNIESGIQQIENNLNFELMDEAESWIDSVSSELERLKQEHIEKIEQWKSTGRAVVKNTATFFWNVINQK